MDTIPDGFILEPRCALWNDTEQAWSSEGLQWDKPIAEGSDYMTCLATHAGGSYTAFWQPVALPTTTSTSTTTTHSTTISTTVEVGSSSSSARMSVASIAIAISIVFVSLCCVVCCCSLAWLYCARRRKPVHDDPDTSQVLALDCVPEPPPLELLEPTPVSLDPALKRRVKVWMEPDFRDWARELIKLHEMVRSAIPNHSPGLPSQELQAGASNNLPRRLGPGEFGLAVPRRVLPPQNHVMLPPPEPPPKVRIRKS